MDKNSAINLIENTFNAKFEESRFTLFIKNLLNDVEPKSNAYSGNYIWDDHKEHINTYKRIGKYIDPEGDALDVLIVEVKSVTKLEKARTTLRNFVIKHLSKFEKDYALVAFYSKDDDGADWRFSFIKLEHQSYLDEEKQKVKTRKEYTPAKRYSFLVGEYEKAYTAKNQLLPLLQNVSINPTLEEIENAFSIEKVTDEFFTQYKDLYVKLYEHFENDNHVKSELAKANIDNTRFTKKLLGQIVFLYFLQKKGWLGVPKTGHWGKGNRRFIQDLFIESTDKNKNFFKTYLQYLFYEALAKERNNENSFYNRFNCRIPFLNGGLFEAEYDWKNANISIPENLFRNSEKNKAGDIGTGILDVFDRYNFTIKEDEPLDKEVAVDPEMLGKVFENMLDIVERKSKGAFYTPREIVHYMCQESLIHYLDNSLESKVAKADIETYIRKGHFALEHDQRVVNKGKETKDYKYIIPESIRKNADLIDKMLTEIRICDPAIGSGAFPVGLLQELVNAQLVIKPHFSKEYFAEKLKKNGIDSNNSNNSESRYVYRLKRHIIQESIYGVDIDASAIDIARLRLWLSLVVDEDDLDPIETLPNLDYKIVCGNSVIGMPENAMHDLNVEKEMEGLKQKFYNETNEAKRKELRTQINSKIRELLDSAETFAGYKIDFDFKLFFSEVWHEKGGFDVVIGNPPYVEQRKIKMFRQIFQQLYESYTGMADLYVYFYEKGIKILNKKGFQTLITSNKFIKTGYGIKLREFLVKRTICEITDFSEVHVFKALVSSCIFSTKEFPRLSNLKFTNITNGLKGYASLSQFVNINHLTIPLSNLKPEIWLLDDPIKIKLKSNIEFGSKKVKNINGVRLNRGITTGHNPTFLISEDKKNALLNEDAKAGALIKPLLQGRNIKKWKYNYTNEYLIFAHRSYQIENYSSIYKWLLENKNELENRQNVIRDGELWWQIPYSVAYKDDFEVPKIIWGLTADKWAFTIDKGCHFLPSNGYILASDTVPVNLILSQLNSVVSNFYFSFIGIMTAGGAFTLKHSTISEIPIKVNIDEKNSHIICTLVDYLLLITNSTDDLLFHFFDSLNDAISIELNFGSLLKDSNKQILPHIGSLKPISDEMNEEEKLAIIQSEFERLYDPNHPVRNNIETLDSIEEVRIIKEALK